jgi:PKD repeat protein
MKRLLLVLVIIIVATGSVSAQNYNYGGYWGKQGFNLVQSKPELIQLVFSIRNFSIDPVIINGQNLKKVSLPGVFLPNDAGKPDLPGTGHYIAIPQGSTPHLRIVDSEVETIQGLDLSPAPELPLDTQKDIVYPKDAIVYSTNAFYPSNPVQISAVEQFRGSDVVMLGITPFQYNPVTKELKVYKNIKIELTFEGGKGTFGNDAYRSPYWDPIMAKNILNFASLPEINYPARMQEIRNTNAGKSKTSDECEYIIISPNGPDFLRWADSLKNFRSQQGILTNVFTLTDVGGNTESAIQSFIDNAYNTWTIKPVACLLLGDYGTDPNKNIISHLYTHPASYPNFASDNYYADVTGDEMPDVVFARIAANDSAQLRIMVGRILNFERNRPVDTGYYMHPISALGWEDDRWFQLCSEIVGGFWKNVLHKHVQRINALYTPANNYINGPWSTASNTNTIMSYFGPSGLNYIPTIPGTLGGFTGGNASMINSAINSGSFILLHRDHGNYTGWGEPSYSTGNINQLTNTLLPFVFSINCETGAYHNPSGCPGACFQEVFQRLTANGHNAGALGLVCPSEVSYSFVNDTYLWGVFDNLWPDFMPANGTTPPSRGILPAFGNAAGKYFLKQSSWPYNSGDKLVTYRLFHAHCDAFLQLSDTVPLNLTVVHDAEVNYGSTTVNVQANENAFIALTVSNEIIATAYGSASGPVAITIPVLPVGTQIMIVVTKQNYNRYTDYIMVADQNLMAEFTADHTNICVGSSVNFTDHSLGTPTEWSWTFQGGSPGTSTDKNPTNILYSVPGTYDVSLTVTKSGQNPDTTNKTAYINVFEKPGADFAVASACIGSPASFTDQSVHPGSMVTAWSWNFGDPTSGSDNTSNLQNPTHTFATAGTYPVTLDIQSSGGCIDSRTIDVIVAPLPGQAGVPSGNTNICQGAASVEYTTSLVPDATSYSWVITPDNAGVIMGSTNTASLDLNNTFFGQITVKVQAGNSCGNGAFSNELTVNVASLPDVASKPNGPDSVNTNRIPSSVYTTTSVPNATGYDWVIDNAAAGIISGDLSGTALWTEKYSGHVKISVKSKNECGDAVASEEKTVVLYASAGIGDINFLGFDVHPNPTSGKITIVFDSRSFVSININVMNALGASVFTEKDVKVDGKFSKVIDLSRLPDGIYYVKIETGSDSLVRKIVIRK